MCPDSGSSLHQAKSSPVTGVADVHLIQQLLMSKWLNLHKSLSSSGILTGSVSPWDTRHYSQACLIQLCQWGF